LVVLIKVIHYISNPPEHTHLMSLIRGNKLVRVRFEYERYYIDKLMRFKDFVALDQYKAYGEKKYLKPFKWYEQIQRLLFHQAFWILRSKSDTKRVLTLNNTKTISISIVIFITNSITGWGIVEAFKLLLKIPSAFQ
jgi:hypothetical protein